MARPSASAELLQLLIANEVAELVPYEASLQSQQGLDDEGVELHPDVGEHFHRRPMHHHLVAAAGIALDVRQERVTHLRIGDGLKVHAVPPSIPLLLHGVDCDQASNVWAV